MKNEIEKMNIAFKCTFNDGGMDYTKNKLGFRDTCSKENIITNIKNGRVWCSHRNNKCYRYYKIGFKGGKPKEPCLESRMFIDWAFDAGWFHTGKKKDTPATLKRDVAGKIAVFTTRFPGDEEKDRKIIGLFKIDKAEQDEYKATIIQCNKDNIKDFCIELPIDEAKELNFWNYYENQNNKREAKWGTGIFRYLSDEQVINILLDIKELTQSEDIRRKVANLLDTVFPNLKGLNSNQKRMKIIEKAKKEY